MCFLVNFFLSSYKNRKKIIKIFLECWRNGEFFLGIKILNFDLFRDFDFEALFFFIMFLAFCNWFWSFIVIFFDFGVLFCKSQTRTKTKILFWHGFLNLNKESKNHFKFFFWSSIAKLDFVTSVPEGSPSEARNTDYAPKLII